MAGANKCVIKVRFAEAVGDDAGAEWTEVRAKRSERRRSGVGAGQWRL
ncbi:hypothetical protein QO003_001490 [Arthrobacter silviterrae]|nr:hypothetical protein [Arthrobacter silviterrae]